jgi:hypothetical protein
MEPMHNMDDSRLTRIEQKLDKLSDAIVSIVRVEERMVSLFKKMEAMDERQNTLDKRMAELEKVSLSRGVVFRLVDKLAWLAIGALAVIFVEMFKP